MVQLEASAACIAEKKHEKEVRTEHIIQMIAVSKKRRKKGEGEGERINRRERNSVGCFSAQTVVRDAREGFRSKETRLRGAGMSYNRVVDGC